MRSAIAGSLPAHRRDVDQLGGEREQVGHRELRFARAVVAQHVVELRLVVALARLEPLEHEHARQAELAAGERRAAAWPTPRRTTAALTATDLLAGLGVDHRDRPGEDAPRTEHHAVAHAGAVGHDAAAADQALVADHHRRGLGRLEHAADADAAGQVDVVADLGARTDRRPGVDHRVRADPGADVRRSSASSRRPVEERAEPGRRAGHHPHPGGLRSRA